MFVDRLNPTQQQALLDLAVVLAGVDNDVSEEELQYLNNLSQTYGLKLDLENSRANSLDDVIAVIDTKQSKVIVLQELIKLSYKDGHFGPEEQQKVFQIAQKLGLNDPELLLAIEKWVRQGFDWLHEGEQMLN
ncbi:TerB family tellurite resistance protein [Thiomicrospira sp. ALE5]|uniref:TerB family tellurite resistance protein n=1 Tax=Thiomicrospira sp. ALE5 TaxID=748650 RepID=UPI0008DEF4EE|nr:TerB family tellurite resistance protein [Thiomicrospira sp. ALE5]SFR63027.1 Tellurite resistance protein TerB [Thiomicrospira sp. ALE5]